MESTATYSIAEAAQALRLSAKTIRRYIKAGKLPSIKVPTKFGEEYRITAIPDELKEEAAAIAEAEARTDVIAADEADKGLDAQALYKDNLRMAAQLGATTAQLSVADERIKNLESQLKLLEGPRQNPELEAARARIAQLESELALTNIEKQAALKAGAAPRAWWKRLLGRGKPAA